MQGFPPSNQVLLFRQKDPNLIRGFIPIETQALPIQGSVESLTLAMLGSLSDTEACATVISELLRSERSPKRRTFLNQE